MTTEDQYAPIREAIAVMQDQIKDIWAHYDPELRALVDRGAYETARDLHRAIARSVEPIKREIIELTVRLPPFVEVKDGVTYLLPVTPENEHLLRKAVP